MSRRSKKSEERPLGVKVLAGFAGLAGMSMVVMSTGMEHIPQDDMILGGASSAWGGLIVLLGLFYIAYGVGLWHTENWGWWAGMITNGIAVLSSFNSPVFMVISLAVMVYLYSIRDLFEITF